MSEEAQEKTVLEVVQVVPEKVVKQILKYGKGTPEGDAVDPLQLQDQDVTPPKGAEVSVHYVGRLSSNGSKFDSSRDRGEPFKFTLGENRVIKGWETVVPTMKCGEVADVKIASDYAYGEHGSPPTIPGDAELTFEIELLSWKDEEDATPDFDHEGSIMKKVIQPATQEDSLTRPSEGSKCVIKYSLRVLDPQDTMRISSTHSEVIESQERFEFVLGEEQTWNGLEAAVQSLSNLERARFRIVDHLDMYGFAGKASRELATKYGIPEDSKLLLDVELLEYEKVKSMYDMSNTERLDECERMRQEGNDFFKKKRLTMARKRYQKALNFVKNVLDFIEEEDKKRCKELAVLCHSNLAAVSFSNDPDMRDLDTVVHHTTQALDTSPNNVKCLFRRASARRELKELDDAMADITSALNIEPNNKALQIEKNKIKVALKAQEQKEKAVYARMFQ